MTVWLVCFGVIVSPESRTDANDLNVLTCNIVSLLIIPKACIVLYKE